MSIFIFNEIIRVEFEHLNLLVLLFAFIVCLYL